MNSLNITKEKIIETAAEIFSHAGFKKTTMEEIAQALNRAKSSIYYYFSSKQDIYVSILENEQQQMNEALERCIEKEEHPLEKLRAYIKTRLRFLEVKRNFRIAMEDNSMAGYRFIQILRKKQTNQEINVIKNILISGVKEDKLSVDNIDSTASTILFSVKGLESLQGFYEKVRDIWESIDTYLDILFKGISKPPLTAV